MGDDDGEEERVEPGERAAEARDPAPGQSEEEVAGVVDFARVAVFERACKHEVS